MEGDTYVVGAQCVQTEWYYKTLFSCIVNVSGVKPRSVDQDLNTNHIYIATVHIQYIILSTVGLNSIKIWLNTTKINYHNKTPHCAKSNTTAT